MSLSDLFKPSENKYLKILLEEKEREIEKLKKMIGDMSKEISTLKYKLDEEIRRNTHPDEKTCETKGKDEAPVAEISKKKAKEPPSGKQKEKKMSYAEKERAIVKMTKDKHMALLEGFPYTWNEKIKKNTSPNTHAFCYMNITGENIGIVKNELLRLNAIILEDIKKHSDLPSLSIPVEDLVFDESDEYGHTKFICNPITITEKVSKYPITLFFTTYLGNFGNTTHGEVIYNSEGIISKANVYFWRNGVGTFFRYLTIDGEFVLDQIQKA